MNERDAGLAATEVATMRDWAGRCRDLLEESLHLSRDCFQSPDADDAGAFARYRLSASCVMTSESALLLIAYDRLWDADVLVRSVFEGSLKLRHLCTTDADQRVARAREFEEDLPEIGRLRTHERAKEVLLSGVSVVTGTRPFTELTLQPDEEAEIRSRYPSSVRSSIDQRWSYVGLVRSMEAEFPDSPLGARALLHGYRNSSHFAHKDWEGVAIIWDREQREPARRDPVRLAHAARLCSEVQALALLRTNALYRLAELDLDRLAPWGERCSALAAEWDASYANWHLAEYQAPVSSPPDAD
jgi:hypothetical protein